MVLLELLYLYLVGKCSLITITQLENTGEAFYGIPEVLIAECQNRIDKDSMMDILNEFDRETGQQKLKFGKKQF